MNKVIYQVVNSEPFAAGNHTINDFDTPLGKLKDHELIEIALQSILEAQQLLVDSQHRGAARKDFETGVLKAATALSLLLTQTTAVNPNELPDFSSLSAETKTGLPLLLPQQQDQQVCEENVSEDCPKAGTSGNSRAASFRLEVNHD